MAESIVRTATSGTVPSSDYSHVVTFVSTVAVMFFMHRLHSRGLSGIASLCTSLQQKVVQGCIDLGLLKGDDRTAKLRKLLAANTPLYGRVILAVASQRKSVTQLLLLPNENATIIRGAKQHTGDDQTVVSPDDTLNDNVIDVHSALKILNEQVMYLLKLRQTAFSDDEPAHVALLNRLHRAIYSPASAEVSETAEVTHNDKGTAELIAIARNEKHDSVVTADVSRAAEQNTPPRRSDGYWGVYGFQGADPATDLRGGGIFVLECIVAVAEMEPELMRAMMTFSTKVQKGIDQEGGKPGHHWFLPALVIINFACGILNNGFSNQQQQSSQEMKSTTTDIAKSSSGNGGLLKGRHVSNTKSSAAGAPADERDKFFRFYNNHLALFYGAAIYSESSKAVGKNFSVLFNGQETHCEGKKVQISAFRGIMVLLTHLLHHFFIVWQEKKPFVMDYNQWVGPNVLETFFTPKELS